MCLIKSSSFSIAHLVHWCLSGKEIYNTFLVWLVWLWHRIWTDNIAWVQLTLQCLAVESFWELVEEIPNMSYRTISYCSILMSANPGYVFSEQQRWCYNQEGMALDTVNNNPFSQTTLNITLLLPVDYPSLHSAMMNLYCLQLKTTLKAQSKQ